MGRKSGKKRNYRVNKRVSGHRRRKNPTQGLRDRPDTFMGIPKSLIFKQDKYQPGEKHISRRTGMAHDVIDASELFEGYEKDEAQLYFCGNNPSICGYQWHKIEDLLPQAREGLQINTMMAEIFDALLPVAHMATEQEKKFSDAGLVSDPVHIISAGIPLHLARRVRAVLEDIERLAPKRGIPISGTLKQQMDIPSNIGQRLSGSH